MRVSLSQQIEEVDRELEQRARVYPHQIAKGAMRQSIADYHVARMQAVRATLAWLAENEAEIRSHVATKRQAAAPQSESIDP